MYQDIQNIFPNLKHDLKADFKYVSIPLKMTPLLFAKTGLVVLATPNEHQDTEIVLKAGVKPTNYA